MASTHPCKKKNYFSLADLHQVCYRSKNFHWEKVSLCKDPSPRHAYKVVKRQLFHPYTRCQQYEKKVVHFFLFLKMIFFKAYYCSHFVFIYSALERLCRLDLRKKREKNLKNLRLRLPLCIFLFSKNSIELEKQVETRKTWSHFTIAC